MPRTATKAPRRLPGLTYRQTMAVRQIEALHKRFAENASMWHWHQMAEIADQCDRLIEEHFPETWARMRLEREAKVVPMESAAKAVGVESVTVTNRVEAVFRELEEVAAS